MVSTKPVVAVLSGMALILAACSPPMAAQPTAAPTAAPAKPPAAQDTMARITEMYYEAARKEGALIVYGAGEKALWEPVRDAFAKRFPGINVEGVDQRGRETREKIIAEQQSRNYVADIAISGPDTQAQLAEAGFVEEYAAIDLDKTIPALRHQHARSSPRAVTLYGWAVNTNLVPPDQEPKSWNDVLDPKWKGKMVMDDPRGSGPGGTNMYGPEKMIGQTYTTRLAEQDVFFATQDGPLWTALVRGERALFLSAGHPSAIAQRRAGAPIKYIKPAEGVGLTPSSQSLIKNAPHPNAAKLWIEWILTEEGQTAIASVGYAPVREGIKTPEPEADMNGIKFLPRDDDAAGFAELAERTKRWESLFFKT